MLTPGISPDEPPQLHKIGAYKFQKLCRDLLEVEPEVAICNVYGLPGQSQYGIDLLAHRKNGNGIEVGQCKCYEDFPPADIRQASNEFWKYWAHWSTENVERFILFVACDLSTRQRQDEIAAQKKYFATLNIAYEAWSLDTIVGKLRLQKGIVSSHLQPAEYWVRVLCGEGLPRFPPAVETESQASVIVNYAMVSQFEKLATHTSSEIEQRLEIMRSVWREGHEEKVTKWIQDIKSNNDLWPVLSPEVKAKVLRFEAGIELDTHSDIARVKQLADEALSIAPSDNQARLRAMIALRENDPEAALRILADQDDEDSINLRAGILLELGRIDESLELLTFEDEGAESNG